MAATPLEVPNANQSLEMEDMANFSIPVQSIDSNIRQNACLAMELGNLEKLLDVEPGPSVPRSSRLLTLPSSEAAFRISQDILRTREVASGVKPFRRLPLYGPEPRFAENIQLETDLPLTRNYSAWTLAAITTILAIFTLLYAWDASIPVIRLTGLLWSDPQKTIFTINLSSYIVVLFLDSLVGAACDNLRWALCCKNRVGAGMLDFLALAGSTTTFGLVQLLFSRKVKVDTNEGLTYWRRTSFRVWSAQRQART